MARPLRFRRSPESWSLDRVREDLHRPLDANLGARMGPPWFKPPTGYTARRFEMDNGDVALFCWDGSEAYWIGNTETPSALWKTEKYAFEEVPPGVADWAERELLAQLHEEAAWLEAYPAISWFFLPVLLSKDGRETSREFFREHAAGFPDTDRDSGLTYYEEFLETGVLDDHRYEMAAKLGTSERLDLERMRATMSEFTVAKLLHEAGYRLTPEIDVHTGHAIDFRAHGPDGRSRLVEVTRPRAPADRRAGTPRAALRETTDGKASGQLSSHGGTILFVDCSSFPPGAWEELMQRRPHARHEPAVVFWARPDGTLRGYRHGGVDLELPAGIE